MSAVSWVVLAEKAEESARAGVEESPRPPVPGLAFASFIDARALHPSFADLACARARDAAPAAQVRTAAKAMAI